MTNYDASRFDPPAPVARVVVKSEQLNITLSDVPMLIDTGADVSLLPRAHVEQLLSVDAEQYEVEGFDGTKSVTPAVTAQLHFLGKTFRGQFLLVDNWHGIIGRNILNNLVLLLDGPARTWSMQR